MSKTKLFFWPGSVFSTLYYVRYDEDSGSVDSMDSVRQASLMAFNEQGILIGNQAINAQYVSSSLELYNTVDLIDDKQAYFKGERLNFLDSVSLIFFYMFQRLDKSINEKYGHSIDRTIEAKIIDLGNAMSENPTRTISAMTSYLDLDYQILSKEQIFKTLLNKNEISSNSSNIVTADDYMEKQSNENDNSSLNEIKFSAAEIKSDLSSLLQEAGLAQSEINYRLHPFLNSVISKESSDWIEQSHFSIQHDIILEWTLDRIHIEKIVETQMSQLEIDNQSELEKDTFIIGDYSNLLKDQFENVVACLSRENIIGYLLGDAPALPFNKDKPNILKITVNDDKSYKFKWKPHELPKKLKIKHTVHFFGRSNESLTISISDEYGKLIGWDITLGARSSVDMGEIEIHLLINRNNNIDVHIEETESIYVELLEHIPFNGDNSLRPVSLREELIDVI